MANRAANRAANRMAGVGLSRLALGTCLAFLACTSPAPEGDATAPSVGEAPVHPEPLSVVEDEVQLALNAPWDASDIRSAFSRGGTYLVKWRPTDGRIPKNEHFSIDLWIFSGVDSEAGAVSAASLTPVDGAKVGVAGWMPAHGHGMIRQPQAKSLGGGYYLVTGMLFHMGGKWQLFFDLIVDGVSERTAFDLIL